MRLLITNGVQQGRVLRLKPGLNRIGRSVENHFQVPDPSVSSGHCEVIYSDVGVLVRDLGSTNGTYVDGEPVQEGHVDVGHVLQVGNVQMTLEDPPVATESVSVNIPDLPPQAAAASAALADGSLTCANHPELIGIYRCTRCGQALCDACVRIIKRVGGGSMAFCSLCTGPCEALLPPEQAAPVVARQRKSFLGRLTQTLKLPFKRG